LLKQWTTPELHKCSASNALLNRPQTRARACRVNAGLHTLPAQRQVRSVWQVAQLAQRLNGARGALVEALDLGRSISSKRLG
jgi:hypothetical protein